MHSFVAVYIVSIILFNEVDSLFGRRHMHRRNRQAFKPPPINPITNQVGSIPPQTGLGITYSSNGPVEIPPVGYSNFPHGSAGEPSGSAGIPPGNTEEPPGSAGVPPGSAGVPPDTIGSLHETYQTPPTINPYPFTNLDSGLPPKISYVPDISRFRTMFFPGNTESSSANANLLTESTRILREIENSNSNSNLNPSNVWRKRRRKNVTAKDNKWRELVEKKGASLKKSTKKNALNKNKYLKHMNNYLGNGARGDTTTFIPLPKGLQLKTASKQNNRKINATVNITSSTQKISYDNTTEIENVVEMQMEKKIEDDKGANRGSEEVRIIETERVKPLIKKNGHGLNILKRRRKSYSKRFNTNHRTKRSIVESTERPKINSVFNKMARRFFKAVKRKERVVEGNDFLTRQMTPNFRENSSRYISSPFKITRGEMAYDRDEMNDFVRFFLNQMQKYRKSRERTKNSTLLSKGLNAGKLWKDAKLSTHKIKKISKNLENAIHVNALLNLNIKWDITLKEHSSRYRKIMRNHSFGTTGLKTTPIAAVILTTQQQARPLVYTVEKKELRLLHTALFFSIMISCLFILLLWIMRGNLCRILRMNDLTPKIKSYQIFHGGQNENMKGLKYTKINNVCTEDYPQLEWQSESGDWLSDKETDFK